MILFSLKNYEYLEKDLLNLTFMDKGEFNIHRFRNRELYIKIGTIVRGDHCVILGTIAPPEENLVSVLMLAHTLKKEGAHAVTFIAPYLAYSRHDKDKAYESLGAKYIGKLLEASGIDDVWTVDVHSLAAIKLLEGSSIVSLSADEIFAKVIAQERLTSATLVAPDTGAIPKCNSIKVLADLSKPLVYFEKKRTEQGISHVGPIGSVGTKAVIVNDILDTGETLISVCERLKKSSVKEIYVMVTHGLFTGKRWMKLWDLNVKKIYCTDSVPAKIKSRKIVRVSVLPLLMARLKEQAESPANGEPSGGINIGIDTWEEGLSEEAAPIYPIKERQRLEVNTSKATNPSETDEGDSQYDAKLWATPDDASEQYSEMQEDKFIEKH